MILSLVLGICILAATMQPFLAFLVPELSPWLGSTCYVLCFHQDGPITVAPLSGPHISFGLFWGFQEVWWNILLAQNLLSKIHK